MTRKSLQRLDQIAKPNSFDDQKGAAEIADSETDSSNLSEFLEAMLSQFKRIIHGDSSGKWHDDPASIFGGDASLKALFFGGSGGGFDVDKIVVDQSSLVVVSEAGNVITRL